jgi:hypothetical protein
MPVYVHEGEEFRDPILDVLSSSLFNFPPPPTPLRTSRRRRPGKENNRPKRSAKKRKKKSPSPRAPLLSPVRRRRLLGMR